MSAPPPPPPGWVVVDERDRGPSRSRLPLVLLVLVLVLAAGGLGVGTLVVLGGKDTGPDAGPGVSYPSRWAPEVKPFVSVVEKKRGLRFEHPVYVDFLSDAEFREQVTSEEQDLTREDRKELEQATGLLRATGLLEGDLDLFEATNKLSGAAVIGYYSFEDERVRMRGEKLTLAAQSTLVHELTHALQDQHFDLGGHYDSFGENDGTAESVYRALVEGDASRVETEWAQELSAQDQKTLQRAQQADARRAETETRDLPPILTTLMSAPYALGEGMVELAIRLDGEGAVDELFESPPVNEESILDPWTVLVDHDRPTVVSTPTLTGKEKEFDQGEFGALTWYLLLAERLPALDALEAADGWGGDRYVGFDRGGRSCVRIAYAGERPRDTRTMQRAVRRWIAALPGAPASVRTRAGQLLFESCDPGTEARVGRDGSSKALSLALSRTYLTITFLRETGGNEPISRCLADRFVREFTLAELNDPKLATNPAFQARLQQAARGCRPD